MMNLVLWQMMDKGNLDGEGALNEHEFYIFMIILSPYFMAEVEEWLNNSLVNDLEETIKEN